jgi:histone-lysine N-methyltransferase SETD1
MNRHSAGQAPYAKFLPSAPRDAKDRAKERDKASLDSPTSDATDANDCRTPLGSRSDHGTSSSSRPKRDDLDTALPQPLDDIESFAGDSLNNLGSASSHVSSSCSAFSASTPQASATASKPHSSMMTPITTVDSPTYAYPSNSSKPYSTTPKHAGMTNGATNGTLTSVVERLPARNPARSVKGVKCTYDPALDRSISSSDKKKAKPTYKEFGMVRIQYRIYKEKISRPSLRMGRKGERHLLSLKKKHKLINTCLCLG